MRAIQVRGLTGEQRTFQPTIGLGNCYSVTRDKGRGWLLWLDSLEHLPLAPAPIIGFADRCDNLLQWQAEISNSSGGHIMHWLIFRGPCPVNVPFSDKRRWNFCTQFDTGMPCSNIVSTGNHCWRYRHSRAECSSWKGRYSDWLIRPTCSKQPVWLQSSLQKTKTQSSRIIRVSP